MGELENAIKCCVDVFVKNCGEGSDCLNMDEFKTMMGKEITASSYKGKFNVSDLDEAFSKLDKNDNGEISIQEFSRCISILIKGYYRKNVKAKKGGKGGRGRKQGGKGDDGGEDEG
ncbi:uncharacterized protein ACBT44_014366 isoform 1-T1 [Syngnathus typhle]